MRLKIILIAFVGLAACNSARPVLVGNDRDEHGCIGSAGYIWSEVSHQCVRPWEGNLQMHDATDEQSTVWMYGLFSSDFSRAEIFPVDSQTPVVLARFGHEWRSADMNWRLVRHPGKVGQQEVWELFQGNTLRFRSEPVLTQPLPYDTPATANAN